MSRPAAPRRPRTGPAERRAERATVEDPAIVLAAAARLLEARARSVDEVRRRLAWAGYQAGLVEAAIERLLELEILDDEAFARAWVASRDRARPRGARALRDELRRKGLAQAVIDAVLVEREGQARDDDPPGSAPEGSGALDGSSTPEGGASSPGPRRTSAALSQASRRSAAADESAAQRLLERHASGLARVADPRKRRQRAYALLARNGFDPEVAGRLARQLDMPDPGAGDEGPPGIAEA